LNALGAPIQRLQAAVATRACCRSATLVMKHAIWILQQKLTQEQRNKVKISFLKKQCEICELGITKYQTTIRDEAPTIMFFFASCSN
jgi:hypothetical protein